MSKMIWYATISSIAMPRRASTPRILAIPLPCVLRPLGYLPCPGERYACDVREPLRAVRYVRHGHNLPVQQLAEELVAHRYHADRVALGLVDLALEAFVQGVAPSEQRQLHALGIPDDVLGEFRVRYEPGLGYRAVASARG